MGERVTEPSWSLLPLALLTVACSSVRQPTARDVADANDTGRTLPAVSEPERQVLSRVAGLPNDTASRVGEASVIAEAPYTAASGRSCRALHITSGASRQPLHRVACTDGGTWFFVPDVFGAPGGGAGE